MEIASLIISIISMIGTLISAITAFTAKSEVKKIKINQSIQGNENKQYIGGNHDGK